MIKRIAISTECVCDLPKDVLEKNKIHIIYLDIKTDKGSFRDTDEVNALNILEYMRGGGKMCESISPSPNDFKNYFTKLLREYDEVVHLCISSGTSKTVSDANLAKAKMGIDGKRVHIIDSLHLSNGMGILALYCAELRDEGKTAEEIVRLVEAKRHLISTSFIVYDAEYLYYNGRVSETLHKICKLLSIHPVLAMKDGVLSLKGARLGSFDRASARYIRSELKKSNKINTKLGFIVYAGCSIRRINYVKEMVAKKIQFDELIVDTACASVSANCGPNTFGIMVEYKEK